MPSAFASPLRSGNPVVIVPRSFFCRNNEVIFCKGNLRVSGTCDFFKKSVVIQRVFCYIVTGKMYVDTELHSDDEIIPGSIKKGFHRYADFYYAQASRQAGHNCAFFSISETEYDRDE